MSLERISVDISDTPSDELAAFITGLRVTQYYHPFRYLVCDNIKNEMALFTDEPLYLPDNGFVANRPESRKYVIKKEDLPKKIWDNTGCVFTI